MFHQGREDEKIRSGNLDYLKWLAGLEHDFVPFPYNYWECHHPNGRTLIFFRGVGEKPPARWSFGRFFHVCTLFEYFFMKIQGDVLWLWASLRQLRRSPPGTTCCGWWSWCRDGGEPGENRSWASPDVGTSCWKFTWCPLPFWRTFLVSSIWVACLKCQDKQKQKALTTSDNDKPSHPHVRGWYDVPEKMVKGGFWGNLGHICEYVGP